MVLGLNSMRGNQKLALLMIDFQRDFCENGGYAWRHGGTDWVEPILPKAKALLTSARNAGMPVFHTREGYAPDLSDCHPQKLTRSRAGGCEIGSAGPLGRLLIRGHVGHDIIPLLAPQPGEIVIDKSSYSAFHETELLGMLTALGVTELLVAGVTADVCVHSTLRSATEYGLFCHYVADAISTFDPAIRRACEKMVQAEGGVWGRLTTVAEISALYSK